MGHECRDRAWTEIERRIVSGELAAGERVDEEALSEELDVRVGAVREALSALERDGFVRGLVDGGYAVAELNEVEVREAYPVAILLEGLALRSTPDFPPEAIEHLRAINGDMAHSIGDPMKAETCDWAFHDELTRHCANEQLLSTLRPLKRMLLRYEHTYMSADEFVDRWVQQHWLIVRRSRRAIPRPPPTVPRRTSATSARHLDKLQSYAGRPLMALGLSRHAPARGERGATRERELALALVFLDAGGYSVALHRMDGVPWIAREIATGKAWTAAAYGAPSASEGEKAKKLPVFTGAISTMTHGRYTPQIGGLPVVMGGDVVGAMGASGASGEEDEAVVRAALERVLGAQAT
jgi:DNA-binding GntR family transcriptional regulator/uncharacterized protein GlcG (DUF336 family)